MEPEVTLEPAVRKLAEERRTFLKTDIQVETIQQTKREDEARAGRERIDAMTSELAEIQAFLERH